MEDRFDSGAAFGFIIGMIITLAVATYIRDRGRDECEAPLKRTEKCVQQWVPAATKEPS